MVMMTMTKTWSAHLTVLDVGDKDNGAGQEEGRGEGQLVTVDRNLAGAGGPASEGDRDQGLYGAAI